MYYMFSEIKKDCICAIFKFEKNPQILGSQPT